MQELSPYQVYQNLLKRWWWVALLILAGGLAGLVVSLFRPAVYEAEATLLVSLDFPPGQSLSQYEEDYSFGLASELVSPYVLASSVEQVLVEDGVALSEEDFLAGASLERHQSEWILRTRHADPGIAVLAARAWASLAAETLLQARHHAVQADLLYEQLRFLLSCSTYAGITRYRADVLLPPQFQDACAFGSLGAIRRSLASTSDRFNYELSLASAVSPLLVVHLPPAESLPVHRLAFGRGLLVFVGALLGWLAGAWLVNLLPLVRGRHA